MRSLNADKLAMEDKKNSYEKLKKKIEAKK